MQPHIVAATIIILLTPPSRQMPPVQSGQHFLAVGIRRAGGDRARLTLSVLRRTDESLKTV